MMVPVGIAVFALMATAGTAFACTNYVGKGTVKGNETSATGTSVGVDCADNGTVSGNSKCLQSMIINQSSTYPEALSGGTLQITMAAAPTGAACYSISGGTGVCKLNSTITWPSGNGGYNITEIQTGFPNHTSSGNLAGVTNADDCMTWPGNPSGYQSIGTVTVDTNGSFTTPVSGTGVSVSSGTLTVPVPSYTLNDGSGGAASGVCISDHDAEDGIQMPFITS